MLLADLGAEVVRIERESAKAGEPRSKDPQLRSRRSVAIDLKKPESVEIALRLIERMDVLIEGFRPGVAERLGLGPAVCLKRNPRLVYARVTGWGQDGPLAQAAGHDINYIALSGALHLIGVPGGKPVPPLNLIGDLAGGGMLLAVGILSALHAARDCGRGQVVDTAMVDGAAALLAMHLGWRAEWYFKDAPGENLLAGAAPYYDTYRTKDDKHVAIGALEPEFFAVLLQKLGLDPERLGLAGLPALDDATVRQRWPELRAAIAEAFQARTRAEWCALMEGSDACFAPVLSVEEAPRHPHNMERRTFIEVDGVLQNTPVPRFSHTTLDFPRPPRRAGEDSHAVLLEAGFSEEDIQRLRETAVLT